jgi:hypothetical protein
MIKRIAILLAAAAAATALATAALAQHARACRCGRLGSGRAMRGWSRVVGVLVVVAVAVAVAVVVPAAGQAGEAPAIAWTPTTGGGAYNYGTLDANASETASQAFTLTNSGGAASAALTVTLTGSSAFTLTANGCSATSLGPKKTCTVNVEYAPTTDGASDSATLTANGKKIGATASLTLTGTSRLPAPAGLTASGGLAQVSLSWSAVSGATGYTVLRSTVSGGPYTPVGTTSNTSFTDSAVADGTTYYYVVEATNAGGTSAASNEASATTVLPAPAGLSALVYAGSSTFYAGIGEAVYKSMDGGATWESLFSPFGSPVRAVAVDPSSPTTVVVGTDAGVVWRTTDGGATWYLASGLPSGSVAALVYAGSSTLYAGIGEAVYKSMDGGATWVLASPGII